MGKLLFGNFYSDNGKIIINPGMEDEIEIFFEQLPVQFVINGQYYILGQDANEDFHLIQDKEGGSIKK